MLKGRSVEWEPKGNATRRARRNVIRHCPCCISECFILHREFPDIQFPLFLFVFFWDSSVRSPHLYPRRVLGVSLNFVQGNGLSRQSGYGAFGL
jgi:hypothetical protein